MSSEPTHDPPDSPSPAARKDAPSAPGGEEADRPIVAVVVDSPRASESVVAQLAKPNFLHPSSVLFDIIAHIRQLIIPMLLGTASAVRGYPFGGGVAGVIFAFALGFTLLRYFTLKYRLGGDELVVTEGLLFRRVRVIPIRRIQNIDLVQTLVHRWFGVAEVVIETASGGEPEARLRVLRLSQIAVLEDAIRSLARTAAPSVSASTSTAPSRFAGIPPGSASASTDAYRQDQAGSNAEQPARADRIDSEPDESILVRIPTKHLVLAGLASNRGIVLVGMLTGYLFQQDYETKIDLPALFGHLPQQAAWWMTVGVVVGGALAAIVALRLMGVAWYLLRFFDYRLSCRGTDLRVSCGLLTRVSATVPRRRIQFISVHRPLLLRWMGLACIRIETAGGAGKGMEDANSTIARRWFCPVLAEKDIDRLLRALRPAATFDWERLDWLQVAPRTGRRLMRALLIACMLVTLAGWMVLPPWGWAIGPAVFPPLAMVLWKKAKARRLAITDGCVLFQSGLLTRKLSLAFFDRIQVIELEQSLFDRRWEMASLRVDTAAAGPADHVIHARYLSRSVAVSIFEQLREACSVHAPVWE